MARLAYPWRQSCSRIADGNDNDGLLCLRHLKELVAVLGIEVADPAGAKSLLCGCQAEMLHSDGYVDVAMRLAVLSHPLLLMKHGGEDIQRCFVEPRTLEARLKLLPALPTADYAELPWLPVYGRRSKSHTLLEVRNFLSLYRLVEITATTVAALYDINKTSQC